MQIRCLYSYYLLCFSFFFSMICDSKIGNIRRKKSLFICQRYIYLLCVKRIVSLFSICKSINHHHCHVNGISKIFLRIYHANSFESGTGVHMIESIRINRIICASIRLRIFVTLTLHSIYISFTHTNLPETKLLLSYHFA